MSEAGDLNLFKGSLTVLLRSSSELQGIFSELHRRGEEMLADVMSSQRRAREFTSNFTVTPVLLGLIRIFNKHEHYFITTSFPEFYGNEQ